MQTGVRIALSRPLWSVHFECREEIAAPVRVFLRDKFRSQLPSSAFSVARMSTIDPTPLIVRNRKDFFSAAAFL